MAQSQNTRLEKIIDEALRSGNVHALDVFLQRGLHEGTSLKCSQQFLDKLDKFVCRCLDQKDLRSASLALAVIYKCGENLKPHGGGQGLSGIIGDGLVDKWFEKCRQLWIQHDWQWNETMSNFSEDFFDTLMVIREACEEGTYKITETFLYPLGQLAADPRIDIMIRKEAIRKFNLLLDKIPVHLKIERKIQTSQEALDIMIKLGGQILESGDYDLQIALMEGLCRMATPNQRKNLANQWFSMEHVVSAFLKIQDSKFETDCRKFLNLVNGMQGDKRRVYSYPCLEVYLDKYELLMPSDENLEEFWIDFNHGSRSISFYFSLAEEEVQESQWETICVTENEVESYTITEEGKRKVLQLKLSEVVLVGAVEGTSLAIHFSSSLDILQAAHSVYGHNKNKGFRGKKSSIVKTTVKIIMEENSSQVVPESQVSLGESEKNTTPFLMPASAAPVKMLTPAKKRISESATVICNSAGGSVHSTSSLSTVTSSRHVDSTFNCKKNPASEWVKKNNFDKIKKTVPLEKEADHVLVGQGEEQSLENFVPDTQPTHVRNTSSTWNKLSVSEMLMMPTQKIHIPAPCSSLAQRQKLGHPSSALKVSVPGTGPISQKQLHTELTQRLQQVLSEKKQDCMPQEPNATHGKMSTGCSKSKMSTGLCSSTFCNPKAQQAQRNSPATRKTEASRSVEADAAPNKAAVRALTTKPIQGSILPNMDGETNRTLSSKEKKNAEVAGSMMNLISSHYERKPQSTAKNTAEKNRRSWIPLTVNRSIFNISWLTAAKKDGSGDASLFKSSSKKRTNSPRTDIFAFSTETPLTTLGKDRSLSSTSVISTSDIQDSKVLCSTSKKGQPVKKEKRYVKKHLFSDTDADYTMTEVSWLGESSKKQKPKVTSYSRQAPIKPKAVSRFFADESSDLPLLSPNTTSCSTKPTNRERNVKKKVEQSLKTLKPAEEPNRPPAAGRRPKRAAAASTKSYRELDTDDSQSESEKPPFPKAKKTLHLEDNKKNNEDFQMKKKCASKITSKSRCSKLRGSEYVVEETSMLSKKKFPVQEQMMALKNSVTASQTSLCPSSPLIETMRSVERSTPTLGLTRSPVFTPRGSPLPASPDLPCQDAPTPIMLQSKPRHVVSSTENVKPPFYSSAEKKYSTSRTQSIQSATSIPSLGHQNPSSNSPIGAAEPLLTTTVSTPSPPPSPFPEVIIEQGSFCGFSKVSSVSAVSLSQTSSKSSLHISRLNDSVPILFNKKENTPLSDQDVKPANIHMSGPSRKRHISTASSSEDNEKEAKKKNNRRCPRPRMKPRKLFSSFTEVSAEGEDSRLMASSRMVCSNQWEDEVGAEEMEMDEDFDFPGIAVNTSNLCQQFSSELKKKFQNRNKMVDVYNKQSLKTVQQHVSSLKMQVTKHRTQRLEQVQKVILEEIEKLEQDDTVLKNMEKDLTIYWKKQTVAFHAYREQESKRNETLKTALQDNICHSLDYEQRIFTSQMCLIRKEMKSIQDRLLSEMQAREIQSLKRGLHALFFPDGARL